MLTCFSLQNVMKGLMIMTTDIFNQKGIELNTLILNSETGAIEKLKGY